MKKKYIEFKIYNRINDSITRVLVYDDIKELRKAADRYDKKHGGDKPNKDILGVSHHFCSETFEEGTDKLVGRKRVIGIIRLSKKHCTTEIVSHELLHTALWNFRLNNGITHESDGSIENACFGSTCGDDEETLCHLYGQLFRDITRKLYKHGIW